MRPVVINTPRPTAPTDMLFQKPDVFWSLSSSWYRNSLGYTMDPFLAQLHRKHVMFVTPSSSPTAEVHARDSFPPEGCRPSRSPLIASPSDPRRASVLPTPLEPRSRRRARRSSFRTVGRFSRTPGTPEGPEDTGLYPSARPPHPWLPCPPSVPPRFSSPRSTPCAAGPSWASRPSPN